MGEDSRKQIRFRDSKYKTLFYVDDGENIVITQPNGERNVRSCIFMDEYHVQVGVRPYHICEFAELMERAGNTYVPEKPQELPDHCFSVHPSTGELIFIERGKKGYEIGRFSSDNPTLNRSEADRYNLWDRVTPQVEAAMLGGALEGWASPAARVSSYDLRGSPIKPIRTKSRKPKEESR